MASEERRNFDKAMALLDFVTLDRLAGKPARVLSGGQRKLLELARVLMADPEIILLDEPAAGVNPSLIETIIARIAEINARGVTLPDHRAQHGAWSRGSAGEVFVMADGRLVCQGPPAEVVRDRAGHRRLPRRRRRMSRPTILTRRDLFAGYEPGCRSCAAHRITVAAGEIVAILGPNGAGKSTLIKAIAGSRAEVFRARVTLDGADITALAAHDDGAPRPRLRAADRERLCRR